MKQPFLYHGSNKQNLKIIQPQVGDFNRKLVYATASTAFAGIFTNTPGGTLEALWGRLEGIPFYCERVENVFNRNYESKAGSIYELPEEYFFKMDNLWSEEYVSDKDVPVYRETKLNDIKNHLMSLEEKNEFLFIPYNKRLDYFPDLDNELISNCVFLYKRFGDVVFKQILQYHSKEILVAVKSRIDNIVKTN